MNTTPNDNSFREAARRRRPSPEMSVMPYAPVQRVDGGAFVEMQVWVPDADAGAIDEERAFNEKQRQTT